MAFEPSSRGANTVHDARPTLEGGATGSTGGGHQAVAHEHTWHAGKVVLREARGQNRGRGAIEIGFSTDARSRWSFGWSRARVKCIISPPTPI